LRKYRSQFNPYPEEDEGFMETVRSGDTSSTRFRFSDAVKTPELTLAANQSANQKGVISVMG